MSGSDSATVEVSAGDIAKTLAGERMSVEVPDRRIPQKVYLYAQTAGKTTTTKFVPSRDGPEWQTQLLRPTTAELVPGQSTTEYLEVGFVVGLNPAKYTPEGACRSKARDDERAARGVLRRDPSSLRVYIPTSETPAPMAKFYVGCRPVDGRLCVRRMHMNHVFFYPEFWANVRDGATKIEATKLVSEACKLAASERRDQNIPEAENNAENNIEATVENTVEAHIENNIGAAVENTVEATVENNIRDLVGQGWMWLRFLGSLFREVGLIICEIWELQTVRTMVTAVFVLVTMILQRE